MPASSDTLTLISLASGAMPTYLPLIAVSVTCQELPAIMPATCVPWPWASFMLLVFELKSTWAAMRLLPLASFQSLEALWIPVSRTATPMPAPVSGVLPDQSPAARATWG